MAWYADMGSGGGCLITLWHSMTWMVVVVVASPVRARARPFRCLGASYSYSPSSFSGGTYESSLAAASLSAALKRIGTSY